MKNKEDQQDENRFTYSDDDGLRVLSEEEILNSISGKDNQKEKGSSETIKKSYTQWL